MEKLIREYIRQKMENNPSKQDLARIAKAMEILENMEDDGRYGKAFELLAATSKSTKKTVARQGKVDIYFQFEGGRKPAEVKTNGGRIGNLYHLRKPENAYIIYQMAFTTRTYVKKDGTLGGGKNCQTEPLIFKVSDFLQLLTECKATKVIGHKGQNDSEIAIQGDSMKLYKRLLDYPIVYSPENNYTADDFDGLEI